MVASNHLKLTALTLTLGIIFPACINQSAQAKSAKRSSSQQSKSAKASPSATDEQAVRSQLADFSKLLAAGDAKALALLWTEDGEYIDEDGNQTKGRKAIEQRFAMVFTDDGKPHVQLASETIKFIAPSVALVEGTVQRDRNGQTIAGTHFSLVLVKSESGWLLTRASERPVVSTSNYDFLRHFNWMIGDWSAQNGPVSVNMRAEWVPSKNFILCKYVTTKADGSVSVDMQIIGWDPLMDQPRSWHFDSSGGFGQGLWSKENNQWICDAAGVESDGSTTKSRNIIAVTGPNTFAWSSVNRSVDGMAVGDAPSLQVQRIVK